MTRSSRPFAVEHRALPSRYAARADDLAELRAVIATMRDVPREHVASMADVFHFLRRVTGRLSAIAGRLEVIEERSAATRRERLPSRAAVDPRAIAAGVFRSGPKRQQVRAIADAKGRRVRVLERGRCAGQMELGL